MKKKILLSLVACFIAAGSFIGFNFADNNHNTDISLADISVMAQAEDGDSDEGEYTCYFTWKGTWIGGWHIIDCYTCAQKRVKEFRDRGDCPH
ncbi:MAG: hypothetical protein ACOCUV_02600 [bacterium]